jgi:hypothetical protein
LDASGHGRGRRGAINQSRFAAQEVSALTWRGLSEGKNLFPVGSPVLTWYVNCERPYSAVSIASMLCKSVIEW